MHAEDIGEKYKLSPDIDIQDNNIKNGTKFLDLMIEQAKTSSNPENLVKKNVMYRSGIGQIDFVWGKPGNGEKFKGGYGLSHIIAKHGESTARKAIETIAKGTDYNKQGNDYTNNTQYRLRLHYDGCTAILSKDPDINHWLLTAWDNKEETAISATGEVRDSLGATAATPTLNRHSGVNTTVSADSIRQSAQNSQENFSDKEQFSLGNSRLDELRYRPEMFAKRLINKYHLKADPKEVARKIQKIITEHNKGGRELTTNSDGEWSRTLIADGLADELAKEIAGTVKLRYYVKIKRYRPSSKRCWAALEEYRPGKRYL